MAELSYETPLPPPTTVGGWQRWATAQLSALAAQESWQPGRYGAVTDPATTRLGTTVQLLSRGVWQVPQTVR